MQTADRIQNVDSRLQSGCKMQTENLKSFFVWYVITCHPTTYWASRNPFSAISFHDYLHFCGIFLAHFFTKIDRNVILSLHIVFLLCARVGSCDVCAEFTNVIKADVDVLKCDVTIEYLTHTTVEKQLTALHVVRVMCLFCWQKWGPGPKLFLQLEKFSTLVDINLPPKIIHFR